MIDGMRYTPLRLVRGRWGTKQTLYIFECIFLLLYHAFLIVMIHRLYWRQRVIGIFFTTVRIECTIRTGEGIYWRNWFFHLNRIGMRYFVNIQNLYLTNQFLLSL
jgi:hypothetical protein